MIEKDSNCMLMASYATFHCLYNTKQYKSVYQILSEFIKYTIIERRKISFSLFETKNDLKILFGFDLPIPVIKTAIKGLQGIKKVNKNDLYEIEYNNFLNNDDDFFKQVQHKAEVQRDKLLNALIEYIQEKDEGLKPREEELTGEIIKFIIDDKSDSKYANIISSFIVKYGNESVISECLEYITDGSVLYLGLANNISELGSIKKELTIYLDTEILLDLMGYNGLVYQDITIDFINLVKIANKNGKKIKLKYFRDVKVEIDKLFAIAEDIKNDRLILEKKVAIEYILSNTETAADIREKNAVFYYQLSTRYGIVEDQTDYYNRGIESNNLELSANDNQYNKNEEEARRFISHINKLRKGNIYTDYLEVGHILITETNLVLDISNIEIDKIRKERKIDYKICEFATTTSFITRYLWVKLNKGFCNCLFPKRLDALIKAKVLLSRHITGRIKQKYDDIMVKYHNHEYTKEEIASMVLTLRNKNQKPEDINEESIREALNFDEEYLMQMATSSKQKAVEIEELNDKITELQNKYNDEKQYHEYLVQEQNNVINHQEKNILDLQSAIYSQEKEKERLLEDNKNKDETIKVQGEELDKYKKVEAKINEIKNTVISVIIFFIIIFICGRLLYWLLQIIVDGDDVKFSTLVGFLGLFVAIVVAVSKPLYKYIYKKLS